MIKNVNRCAATQTEYEVIQSAVYDLLRVRVWRYHDEGTTKFELFVEGYTKPSVKRIQDIIDGVQFGYRTSHPFTE